MEFKIGDKITVNLGGNVEPVEALITICNDQLKLVHENIKKNESMEELKEIITKLQQEIIDLKNMNKIIYGKFAHYQDAYAEKCSENVTLQSQVSSLLKKVKRFWF